MTEVKTAVKSRRAGMGPLPGKAWGCSLEPQEARSHLCELWGGALVSGPCGHSLDPERGAWLSCQYSYGCRHFKSFSRGCGNISGLPEGFPSVWCLLPEFSPGLFASRFQIQAGAASRRAGAAALTGCSPPQDLLPSLVTHPSSPDPLEAKLMRSFCGFDTEISRLFLST